MNLAVKVHEKYRVGIVGAGAIAQECHFPGYAKDERAEVVAYAEPNAARHQEITDRFGDIAAYTNYTDMLAREKLDVVSVCVPNKFHAPASIAALRRGCHVLCEKPIATTLAEADRMIAAAKKARKKLMIAFTHRMFRGPQRCKALLADKALGKPFMIRVRFAHGGPYPNWAKDPWFYDPDLAAGGALLDMGIHAIDLCLWLIGPISHVSAQVGTLVKKIEVDDNALMMLKFKNGAMGYIEVGWTSGPGFSGFEIYGTKGTLICNYLKELQFCQGTVSAGGDNTAKWKTLDKNPIHGGWPAEIPHWLNVIDGDARLTMGGKQGRDALAVALGAYASSKRGRRVTLD